MPSSDARIIAASVTDPARFAGIFDRHAYTVRKFVVARLGLSRSDDVVSETFRIAFERRADFETSAGSALPWLYGIANNLVRRDHRSYSRRVAAVQRADGQRNDASDAILDIADRLDARSGARELAEALDTLNDGEREMLLLVAWEELSPTEAATILGIAPETARTRLRRARQHIRTYLERGEFTTEVTTDAN